MSTPDYSYDRNSGAVPQPGGSYAGEPVIVADDDMAFDAAVADETTAEQEEAAKKPARKRAAKKAEPKES